MDNFRQSVQRFGEVYYSMAREVYVEEGREVETMDESGETDSAVLHEMHTNTQTGVTAKRYDLSVGKFNVIADVTEATATRRDKTVRTMMTMAQAFATVQAVDMGQAALLTAVRNMDGEGMDDFQEYLHKKAVSLGLEDMTPEEEAQAKAQQQQPDPQAGALAAQANALNAQAEQFHSQVGKNKAQAILALAQAKKANAEASAPPKDMATDPNVHSLFQNHA
jgi:hypothetical protein